MPDQVVFSVILPPDLYEEVTGAAEYLRQSKAAIVRMAIVEWLHNHPVPEAPKAEPAAQS